MQITKKNVAYKYRQGAGWVVGYYSPAYDAYVITGEKDYWSACNLVKECRQDWDGRRKCYKSDNC